MRHQSCSIFWFLVKLMQFELSVQTEKGYLQKLNSNRLKKGDLHPNNDEKVMQLKWRDKKISVCFSKIYDDLMENVIVVGQQTMKPVVSIPYKRLQMAGVDLIDHI